MVAIPKGKPILFTYLSGGRSPTFSGIIPEGKRALTMPVDRISSMSGFLVPGDDIDLLISYKISGKKILRPLLQNVAVLATDTRLNVDKSEMGTANSGRISTITIAVSGEDSKRLIFAQQQGKITAVLRNPDDDENLSENTMDMKRLFHEDRPAPKRVIRPKKKRAEIEYIIGGQS